jgi:phosphoribosylanthranilate isomerase
MKIKVCGMTYPDNIAALAALPVDLVGFIFYPPSPRCLRLAPHELPPLPPAIRKVGVFVDRDAADVLHTVADYGLHAMQLHGQEPPEQCAALRAHATVIKAFRVAAEADFRQCAPYAGACDYFLFDTRTPLHGGSGIAFDWRILSAYTGDTPFLLSGGVGAADAPAIRHLQHPQRYGVDLNSRFETAPGRKDINLLQRFIDELRVTNDD